MAFCTLLSELLRKKHGLLRGLEEPRFLGNIVLLFLAIRFKMELTKPVFTIIY